MPAKTLTTARWLAAVALLVLSAAPPQPAVMATTTTRAPIVFIPGVMGSRLFNTVDEQEREVWVNLPGALFSSFPELGLAADGISPAQDDPAYSTIHAKPGTAGLVTRVLVADFYETLINHFTQTHGYVENANFWVYTYDWRKDLRTSGEDLDRLIQAILAQTGAPQVSIVAHSLGGLLARQYLFDPARAARVGQAVILGTPFFGTPQAFSALLDGDCLLGVSPICIPGRQTIKELVRNYPAFYQIMPSEAYFAAKGGGFYGVGRGMDVTGPCPNCLSYSQTYTTSLASSLNPTLSGQAWQFHTALDALTNWNGVPVTVIAGQGKNTLVGIRQRERFWWELWRSTIIREPQYTPAGDGTVTLLSANVSSIFDNPQVRVFNADHVTLVKRPEVLAYMDAELGLPALPLAYEISPTASDFTSVQIVAYGVRAIEAYDALGNYTGPVKESDLVSEGIPGSAYFSQADMATLALLGGQAYTITFVPSGVGLVDIQLVRSTQSQALSSTFYLGIDAKSQSRIELVGDPYAVDGLQLDSAGDKRNVQLLSPTSIFTSDKDIDSTPPVTEIEIDGKFGWKGRYISPVTVTLTGIDEGAGVARIEYAFSTDRQLRVYTGPFVVDPAEVGTLYVKAVDRAGNEEFPVGQARLGPERVYLLPSNKATDQN